MKKKLLGFIIGCTIALTPALLASTVYAADPISPPCNTGELVLKLDKNGKPMRAIDPKTGERTGAPTGEKVYKNPCNFSTILILADNVIKFLLFFIAGPLIAVVLCYAGFLLITSGGSSEKLKKAKHMILNAIFGYIIALAAWLIIHTILSSLGFTGETFLIAS